MWPSRRRAYAISNLGNTQGAWHFQIRRVAKGVATEQLFEHLQIGKAIEIDGPYGLTRLRPEVPRDIVCVAGGSGNAWRGETGFVHELVRRTFGQSMPNHAFYFAGPPPMTQGLQEMLMVEFRVPFEQVHFDRFI
jgi:NAD(P)H-flavin reductase